MIIFNIMEIEVKVILMEKVKFGIQMELNMKVSLNLENIMELVD